MLEKMQIKDLILTIFTSALSVLILLLCLKTYDSWGTRKAAVEAKEATVAGSYIVKANAHLAVERGVTNTALKAKDPASIEKFKEIINKRRELSTPLITEGIQLIEDGKYFHDKEDELDKVKGALTRVLAFRKKADEALALPYEERDPTLAKNLVKGFTKLIISSMHLRTYASEPNDNTSVEWINLNNLTYLIWEMSEYAGRERAIVGGILAEGKQKNRKVLTTLSNYRGHFESAWTTTKNTIDQEGMDPRIIEESKKMQAYVFDGFEKKVRAPIYNIIETGEYTDEPSKLSSMWIKESTSSINTILKLNSVLEEVAIEASDRIAFYETINLIFELVLLAISIAGLVFITRFVKERITGRLQTITTEMRHLAEGDLNIKAHVDYEDEIGEMTKALQVFKNNAIEKEKADRQAAILTACLTELKNAVFITDTNGSIVYANSVALKTLENQRGSKIDPTGHSLWDYHEAINQDRAQISVLQEGGFYSNEMTFGNIEVEVGIGTIFSNGEHVGNYIEWRDVTHSNKEKRTKDEVARKVNQIAVAMNSATQDIAQGNQNLSERTEAQAASIEQTTASMQGIAAVVEENTENTKQALALASDAKKAADEGGEVVKIAMKSMEEIKDSSDEITSIITVIDEIAFQTNLLALNAAVEAARAGEQGRGFAVVASEVRSLAGRSAKAASEIKSLIEASTHKVKTGVNQVNRTGECLEEIIQNVESVTEMIKGVASATSEQSLSIQEINKAIVQMDEFTQQNSALVEEGASASQGLNAQSNNLVKVINGEEVVMQ